MKQFRLVAAIGASFALAMAATPPVAAQTARQHTPLSRNASVQRPASVRLITGDLVTVTQVSGGRRAASVTPGPGRSGIAFRTFEQNDHLTVLPSDAAALVSTGRVDRQLFDVTALIAEHDDTAHTDSLPLIMREANRKGAANLSKVSAYASAHTPVRELRSIGARAFRVDASDLGSMWRQLVPSSDGVRATGLADVPHVWLDSRVRASLDRSTAQIGAPEVWQAGFHGEGVKVAVLDTGVDQSHPDLAGRVAETKDFSQGSGTGDAFGHGTHVTSIVGGSGVASGGTRKGVAPGSRLLVGKVLGDDGYGSESQVIAGMEWAAAEGARVVNLSLGSDQPSDGTDPMSQAVDELSERTGTLFVVAAGNAGEQGPGTIGSPGAADAALTVGAVDRDDSLAPFSGRGPRLGDLAVKPDVTAPGVGIVAARAAGTTMGDPVDPYYVAASGTSMAAPHVAGAAALVAQRHPDWTGTQIRDALISTAVTSTGQKVTEQGGGRIDVRAAAMGALRATGTLALGSFETGTRRTDASTLRYTNSSGSKLSVSLSVTLTSASGQDAASAVRLGSHHVDVPAGATVEVPLTVDPDGIGRGAFYGYVTAVPDGGGAAVHTTIALTVHAPVHKLTVRALGRDGAPSSVLPVIWGPDGLVQYSSTDPAVAEVEEGTYQVNCGWQDGASDGEEVREVVLPEVRVTADRTVTLDARTTVPVEIRTPRPAEQRGIVSYQLYRRFGDTGVLQGAMYFDDVKRLYISPTAPVSEGDFEFSSRWQLVAPLLRTAVFGSSLHMAPYYMPTSPLFADRGPKLFAVDAGAEDRPDFRHVRGRLAVLRSPTGADPTELVKRAASAGARAVLLVGFDRTGWTRWTPVGDRLALPTLRTGTEDGTRLLSHLGRPVALGFSGTARSPYLYDVTQVSRGYVPRHVVHTVSTSNSAVLPRTYAGGGGSGWASEQRFGWRPYQDTAWMQTSRFVPTGFTRTEYVSSGDTIWQQLVHYTTAFDADLPLAFGMRDTPRSYRPGVQAGETFNGALVRPAIPVGFSAPTAREGDLMRLRIPEFVDSQVGHWGRTTPAQAGGSTGDSAHAVLYRNGAVIAQADSAWADIEVPEARADYRLDLTTSRTSPSWPTAVATHTSWGFASARPHDATALPLLQLDYRVPVDAHNTLNGRSAQNLSITVRAQSGLPAPRGVDARVEVSYDDGRTWRPASVGHGRTNTFLARVPGPRPGVGVAWATLRVSARDADGDSVRQTVKRAYAVRR
ncbi:S8 family serine peptidase [Streptomyces bauhiniae]|uniref:S8 family serine peptidase n=1 Tax=Streptomyces bauhiniae TaxID=2340725 RepID=UPI0035D7C600